MTNFDLFRARHTAGRQTDTPFTRVLRFVCALLVFQSAAVLCLANFQQQDKALTPPLAPRDLQVVVRDQSAVLTWSAASGKETAYSVYRWDETAETATAAFKSLCDGAPWQKQIIGTTFTDVAVKPGHGYSYAVRPFGAKGKTGECSNAVAVFVQPSNEANSSASGGISVSPAVVSLQELQSQQFTATVSGPGNKRVVWSFSSKFGGTLSYTGVFRAPNKINFPRVIVVTATSVADNRKSGSAIVKLIGGPPTSEFIGDPNSLRPYRGNLTEQEVRHTLRKVALGGSPELVATGVQRGLNALSDALVNCVESADLHRRAIESVGQGPTVGYWHMAATRQYWLTYLIRGCGLQEQMALHLHNWFAADGNKADGNFYYWGRPTQVDLFRDHALGNFQDLLMKMHFDLIENHMLDNRFNTKWNVNENYGREFLELLTTGTKDLNGNPIYDERTMHDVARSLTGFNERWRSPTGNDPPYTTGDYGYIFFDPSRWDDGAKTVFGSTQAFNYESITNHILYNTPHARRYIAGKLFALLAHPNPSPEVIEELSQDLVNNNYDLKPVIKKIISSEAFYSSEAKCGCVVSSAEWLVTLIRITNLPVSDATTWQVVHNTLYSSGHLILEPASVFGWSSCGVNRNNLVNRGEQWINPSVQLARLNGINNLLNEVYYHEQFDWNSLLPNPDASAEAVVRHFERIFNTSLSDAERAKIVEYLNTDFNGDTGATVSHPWSANDQNRVRAKLNGLVQIFGAGLDFNQN